LDKAEPIVDFAQRFGKTFAVLFDHDFGEGLLIVSDELEPTAKQITALLGEFAGPCGKCLASPVYGRLDLDSIHPGGLAYARSISRVEDIDHEMLHSYQ